MNVISIFKTILESNKHNSFYVLYEYMEQLKKNKSEVEASVGKQLDEILDVVDNILSIVGDIHDKYFEGKIRDALNVSRMLLQDDFYIEIPINTLFFRARNSDNGFLYSKDEMFHIPFDKRYLIGNQRYSMSGLPCLYLGGSSYVCWEELGRPDYNRCNFSGFKNQEVLHVYDFCIPLELKSLDDVRRSALILVCSLPADPQHVFKEQYILPQCIFQALIDKHYSNGEPFPEDEIYGIRYYSTHFLTGYTDMFSFDTSDFSQMQRLVNYVFPSLSNSTSGLSKPLKRAFEYSDSTSIMNLTIKNPMFLMSFENNEYLDSLFGAVDDVLRKRIGLSEIRQNVELLTT